VSGRAESDAAAERSWGGHVSRDCASRERKGRKVFELLSRRADLASAEVLDLGAGSGLLSAFLAPRVARLTAADRDASGFLPGDLDVTPIAGDALPFADAAFDIVVFNHVIEHVGPRAAQLAMLREIRRVLRPGGLLYLAAPNRFALVEPHYRLPFLSWLPGPLADRLLRGLGRNDWYDCNPYAWPGLVRALRGAGFEAENATGEAFRAVVRLERPGGPLAPLLARIPEGLARAATPLMPSFVVIARRPADPAPDAP
jgi:SAM-dependent methyltransferase